MNARDLGFLACRVLALVFLGWGLLSLSDALNVWLSLRSADPGMRRLMEDQFGTAAIRFVAAFIFLVGAFHLWVYAGRLNALFVRDAGGAIPAPSSVGVVRTGLGLIGVYFVLRMVPPLIEHLSWFLDERSAQIPMPATNRLQFGGDAFTFAVAFYLAFRNLGWARILSFPRSPDEFDEPEAERPATL